MMRKLLCCLVGLLVLVAGCSRSTEPSTVSEVSAATAASEESPAEESSAAEAGEAELTDPHSPMSETSQKVASSEQMADVEQVVLEGMEPVYADSLNDGTYPVEVDSSSSMFSIVSCELTVADGAMTAVMHMSGKGYLYVFMGTAEEASEAPESEWIPFEEDTDGAHTFTVPVAALDAGIDCAAFSKNKELWYARTLVFRADSLPPDAFREGTYPTVAELGLADGSYTVDVELTGGSGRASVESPAPLQIENGEAVLTVVWSSSNYDYMLLNGEKYLPVNSEGNSTFELPIQVFDRKITVMADTTAMSEPHEIEYALRLLSNTVRPEA